MAGAALGPQLWGQNRLSFIRSLGRKRSPLGQQVWEGMEGAITGRKERRCLSKHSIRMLWPPTPRMRGLSSTKEPQTPYTLTSLPKPSTSKTGSQHLAFPPGKAIGAMEGVTMWDQPLLSQQLASWGASSGGLAGCASSLPAWTLADCLGPLHGPSAWAGRGKQGSRVRLQPWTLGSWALTQACSFLSYAAQRRCHSRWAPRPCQAAASRVGWAGRGFEGERCTSSS